MKILFVENHSVFANQVTSQYLTEHQIKVVPSLAAARTSLNTDEFDLLLVDYDLDDGKGDELVCELRSSGCTTRIIAVSAREEGNAALLQAGANIACSKMEFDRIQKLI